MATIDIAGFIDAAREKARDGLTPTELADLLLRLVRVLMSAVDSLDAPGASKKALVLDGVAQLYDAIAPYFPIPWYLRPFWALWAPTAKAAVLAAASALIELWLPEIRATPGATA